MKAEPLRNEGDKLTEREKAASLKLHLLSEGIRFSDGFIARFARDKCFMEKRKVYNDSDEAYQRKAVRAPQELLVEDVIIAANYKRNSPWILDYSEDMGYCIQKEGSPVTRVTFPRRPAFFEREISTGEKCGYIANLYGGMDLAFFTPAYCAYNVLESGCLYCSLKSNRKKGDAYATVIDERMAGEVTGIALETDRSLIQAVMLVGGNIRDENQNFRTFLRLTEAIEEEQIRHVGEVIWETHIATMPPRDLELLKDIRNYKARMTMNLEVFDDKLFEKYCPGKSKYYGRKKLISAVLTAAEQIPDYRVHSILIAGLEPAESTIAGMHFLAENGVAPIVNVFHNDHGTALQDHPRPSCEDLRMIGVELQKIYAKYAFVPYWNGCGRNSLDYEAREGLF